MTKTRRLWTRLAALVSMVVGLAMIFLILFLMNAQNQPPEKEKKLNAAEMAVVKKKKPKKKQKLKRRVKRKVKAPKKPRAPMPNLAASISGISFGLPQFDGAGLDDAANGVLGGDDAVRGMVMTEEAVDVSPRPTTRSAPVYPPRARAKGVTGKVTLSLLIGVSGSVERVKVLGAEPSGVFEDAAVSAVKQWRFEPALYRGEKVKVWARQVVRFNLS